MIMIMDKIARVSAELWPHDLSIEQYIHPVTKIENIYNELSQPIWHIRCQTFLKIGRSDLVTPQLLPPISYIIFYSAGLGIRATLLHKLYAEDIIIPAQNLCHVS